MRRNVREPRNLRRAASDFLRPSRSQLVVGLILLLCGLMVTLQLQTRARSDTYGNLRRDDLVGMLDDLTAQSRRLEAEVAELEASKRQLQSGADRQAVARREAEKRLAALEIMAGTVPAHGPGVRITIADPQSKVSPEVMLSAINELRDAGAEVVEVNDSIRVAVDTWVGTSPDGLTLDGRRVDRPIVVEAIGNGTTLAEAMRFRGGLVSQVESGRIGGSVAVEVSRDVSVDSVRAARNPQFMRPA